MPQRPSSHASSPSNAAHSVDGKHGQMLWGTAVVQVMSSNEQDGLRIEGGASIDIWSMVSDADGFEGAVFRQNGWCGIHVTGPSALKCSHAKIKANGRHGLVAEGGAAVSARHLEVDANTGTGIMATHGTTVVNLFSCTSAGNRIGLSSTSSLVRANSCRVVGDVCFDLSASISTSRNILTGSVLLTGAEHVQCSRGARGQSRSRAEGRSEMFDIRTFATHRHVSRTQGEATSPRDTLEKIGRALEKARKERRRQFRHRHRHERQPSTAWAPNSFPRRGSPRQKDHRGRGGVNFHMAIPDPSDRLLPPWIKPPRQHRFQPQRVADTPKMSGNRAHCPEFPVPSFCALIQEGF
jgi:hypothetical protein